MASAIRPGAVAAIIGAGAAAVLALWSHPYPLSAVPSDDLMHITVREVGDNSNMLQSALDNGV